jgi:hypothetical protein
MCKKQVNKITHYETVRKKKSLDVYIISLQQYFNLGFFSSLFLTYVVYVWLHVWEAQTHVFNGKRDSQRLQ